MEHDETLRTASGRLRRCLGDAPGRCLLVSVADQHLSLLVDGRLVARYPVSTSSLGVSAREGSSGTPPGVHRIHRKIGSGAPPGTVFRSRVATGERWDPTRGGCGTPEDLVLSRILVLEGAEEGLNRGPGRDSLARHIYIHGTNHEPDVGRPVSGGCIRMTNADVIDLFDRVEEGDAVVVI
jgi:lipoprotein-anchoring transpeptidase ErfK/SrfK